MPVKALLCAASIRVVWRFMLAVLIASIRPETRLKMHLNAGVVSIIALAVSRYRSIKWRFRTLARRLKSERLPPGIYTAQIQRVRKVRNKPVISITLNVDGFMTPIRQVIKALEVTKP